MLSFTFLIFYVSSVAAFQAIRFSSIQQCGSFNVTFSGPQSTALPLTLSVVPFGSSAMPLYIPLPDLEWDSGTNTGVAITFLPYPAGTTFIASLDDARGRNTEFTSDIIKILPSDNSSCISTTKQAQTYTPEPPFSQCLPFNVTFDPAQAVPPVIRLFVPNGPNFLLNQTQGVIDPGTSSFTMVAFRGLPVVLLFRDGSDHFQSTNLLTVTGDVTSSSSCLPNLPNGVGSKKSQQAGLSKQAVIAIAASIASVVALLSALVCLHLFQRRGRRKAMRQCGIEGGHTFKPGGPLPLDSPSTRSSLNAITVINKSSPYPMEEYTSRPVSPYFIQSAPNEDVVDLRRQMQSLNAATADLDQILNTSVFMSIGGSRAWSPTLSPSTSQSPGIRSMESLARTKEQLNGGIPISPLSLTSNFRDSVILPANYMRMVSPSKVVGSPSVVFRGR